MKENYDVIIIGAGPAGLSCASVLADSELSVLIVDKSKTLATKACGGGITHLGSDYHIPQFKTLTFDKQTVFLNRLKFTFHLAHPLKTISRKELSEYQISEVKKSLNIEIQTQIIINKIEKDHIVTNFGKFGFKWLVGADGATSQVRKYLNLPFNVRAGFSTEVQISNPKFSWYVNPRQMGSAYVWCFPHKNHANIGIYYDPEQLPPAAARILLNIYLNKIAGLPASLNILGGVVNCRYSGCEFGNIFLSGDAAGLAILSSGEGISSALISGQEVALKILDPSYTMPQLEHLLKIKNRQEKLHRIYENHPRLQYIFYVIFLLAQKSKRFQKWFGN
jgi:geranylgeranyl reductase